MSSLPTCPTGLAPCGTATRGDVFAGVWCACERGIPGVDLRVNPDTTTREDKTP